MIAHVLLLSCIGVLLVGGELFPGKVSVSQTVSLNPIIPNDEQSIKDCPFTYYKNAKEGLASSIHREPYEDKSFSHVVKVDTNDLRCTGVIVDSSHILTTKHCASENPKTISFHNVSLGSWEVKSISYHLSLDVALLHLRTSLAVGKQTTPACFWTTPTSSGFPVIEYTTRDNLSGNLSKTIIRCQLSERAFCFTEAKKVKHSFLEIPAVSNHRTHPFVVALGVKDDGSLLEVSNYIDWIGIETGSTVDAIDCAVRYYIYRSYESRTITHATDEFQSIQLQNAYISPSVNNEYKVSIGHYMDDTKKEPIVTYSCYGTLISQQYVLTAAGCVTGLNNYTLLVRANELESWVKPNTSNVNKCMYYEEAYVSQIYIHPNYSETPLNNDVALLQLDPNEFQFGKKFKPACLWTHELIPIEEFQSNGHGLKKTVSIEYSIEALLADEEKSELYLISKILDECPLNLTDNQLCVGDSITVVPGTCKNNIGSAMSREVWVFDKVYLHYIFAINNKGENCGFNTPAIFTKVSPYIQWIESIVFGDNLQYVDTNKYHGDACYTPNGSIGVCLTIDECPQIVSQLKDANLTNSNEILCGFEKDVSLVCCQTIGHNVNLAEKDHSREVMTEIVNCPNLYQEFRRTKSQYELRQRRATFVID
ncbi:uncharacterized protein LOC129717802 isoform X2 [Wyeomyia smithii]|uniref:uncharacterized protein LOC129717802 isoform X2 n=1 Tax=Wyeomyia smithii TaxID=174621 RepID=UPI002467C32A|nr:uncharacterized protein LOC129717802 isoform X2 [Wyeomyia smithii]